MVSGMNVGGGLQDGWVGSPKHEEYIKSLGGATAGGEIEPVSGSDADIESDEASEVCGI